MTADRSAAVDRRHQKHETRHVFRTIARSEWMTNNTNTTKEHTNTTSSTLIAGKDVKDFQITAPMIDVRGWDVLRSDGRKLGTVDRIMLDVNEKKPRYLSVALPQTMEYLLLPIGLGSIDASKKQIKLEKLSPETLNAMPVLTDKVVTSAFEQRIYGALTGKSADKLTASERYEDPAFDPTKLFGSKSATLHS
jgi:hypothetical protein